MLPDLNSLHCCLCYRWDKYIISVREAKALPKANCWEWRSKFLYVEGDSIFLRRQRISFSLAACPFGPVQFPTVWFWQLLVFHIALCTCLFLFSEPFDGSNTARAVHEKIKFDAIKAVFAEVFNSVEVLTRPHQDLFLHCHFPPWLGVIY